MKKLYMTFGVLMGFMLMVGMVSACIVEPVPAQEKFGLSENAPFGDESPFGESAPYKVQAGYNKQTRLTPEVL